MGAGSTGQVVRPETTSPGSAVVRIGLTKITRCILLNHTLPLPGQALGTCWASPGGLHIMGEKIGTFDRPGFRYLPGLIFLVAKQVPAIFQVSGVGVDKIIRIILLGLGPMSPYIHELVS